MRGRLAQREQAASALVGATVLSSHGFVLKTSNIQHRASNVRSICLNGVPSMFRVRCWKFDVFLLSQGRTGTFVPTAEDAAGTAALRACFSTENPVTRIVFGTRRIPRAIA